MRTLANARSFLFVPADNERKVASALRSEADAVVLDLEDGVAPSRKAEARAQVRALHRRVRQPLLLVRVAAGEPLDVDAVKGLDIDGLVLAKATPSSVLSLGESGPPVVALIETAEALRDAFELAARSRVAALMLGSLDLAAELGLRRRSDGAELAMARSAIVLASAAASIRSPIDGVNPSVDDLPALTREIELARDLGFRGKACIHPRQLAAVHEGFGPSTLERDWARRIVNAFEAADANGDGAIVFGGELVDRPVYLRALRLLQNAPGGNDDCT